MPKTDIKNVARYTGNYMKLRYFTLVVCLAGLLVSCVSVSLPPKQWAAAIEIPRNTCVSLTGTYINKAIEAPDNKNRALNKKIGRSIYLSEFFIPYIPEKYFAKHIWGDTVEINGVQRERLEVILKRDKKIIFEKILKRGEDFECSTDGLVMSETRNHYNMFGILDIKSEKRTITKSIDGSILVTFQVKEIADVFLIPGYMKVLQLYKFPILR